MKKRGLLVWSILTLFTGFGSSELCSTPDNESVLQVNHAYTYRYRSVAHSQAVGTTEDQSSIVMECDVIISHGQSCFYNLQLQECTVSAKGGEPETEVPWIDQALPEISKYHVEFSLDNGEIKELRTHEDDPLHYVNIKRGVLSAFVFKLSQAKASLQEIHTDIHGNCPLKSSPVSSQVSTKSAPNSDWDVRTSKDMLHCRFPSRPDWQLSPWSLFWNMSFIQHVINSTTDCYYKVNTAEKRIEKVFCKERHAIMLESTHSTTTAVQTNVYYYVDFVKSEIQNSKPILEALTRRADIRFEYEHTPLPQSSPPDFINIATKKLSDLVQDSFDEIKLSTIPQFTDFVAWIRSSHDLTPLVDGVVNYELKTEGAPLDDKMKELALSYLRDALVQCNTVPCVKAITYLAKKEDLSPTYLNFIFHTWSFMHYTKPGFIQNFVDICKLKDSHQCWLSLGAFVRRIYSRDSTSEEKVIEEMKDVANFFIHRIEEDCEAAEESDNNQYTNCLVFMKAASDMGKYFNKLVPDGMSRLLDQATNDNSPTFVRTSALEAIRDSYEVEDAEQNQLIYDRLLPLMKNTSLPTSLRILSYDQLLPVSESYYFEEHLLNILKEEANVEVKFYVADSLSSHMEDHEFRIKREKFINSLNELLEENGLSIESIRFTTKAKSKSSYHGTYLDLPFMPQSLKRFGMKVTDSSIYDSYIYPTLFNQNVIMHLFSAVLPATKLGSYFEGWQGLFVAFQKNMAGMDLNSPSFSKIYEAVLKTLEEEGLKEDSEILHNLDANIITNIKKIHQLYWQHHKKLNPYAKAYLDLFGSTVKYVIQDSFKQASVNKDLTKFLRNLVRDLEEGVTYNTTKVIRVIEAYHQVPTMMGLPLNWTTNATLAFSLRAGLKHHHNYKEDNIQSKGFLQPSIALTFLNRMVLDFPTLTQIGVQANSSGYTSTDLRVHYSSSKGKQTLRFERPSRTQKVLELFRTNQLIKHKSYIDIADWDFERISSSWCTDKNINSIAGLQFCLSKSYPNVTHLIKPWALMAGWCKWQFLIHPVDEKDVSYEIELQQTPKQNSKEYSAKFRIVGLGKEKAVHFKAQKNENGKDVNVELKTSLSPDFSASFTKNTKVSGQKMEGYLKLFKDFTYEVEYSNEEKNKKTQSSTKNNVPSNENDEIVENEEKFLFRTPYAVYKWNKTVAKLGENEKREGTLSCEVFDSKSNWMRTILPPDFWEEDSNKAVVEFFMNWKKPVHLSDDVIFYHTEHRLKLPRYIIGITGLSNQTHKRWQADVRLTKTNLKYGKLETFINFTAGVGEVERSHGNRKYICSFNATIPWRSWSFQYLGTQTGLKWHHGVILKRVWIKPREQISDDHGWCSTEGCYNKYKIEEQEIKLLGDFEILNPTNEELLGRYSTLKNEDIKDFCSSLIVCNVALHYPLYDRMHTVLFDGQFITSNAMTAFRFQKNFDLTSSYNNLQLSSHSVYRTDDLEGKRLYHSSHFTHIPSQTKAYNTILYTKSKPEGRCQQVTFKHDIRSHVFDLSTDASYKCESGDDNLHTLRLTINTNSSKWNMLDIKLNQLVQDVSPDYSREDMTTTHALGTIHVDAEWHGKQRDLQKRVVLCSKQGNCPNAELYIEMFHDGRSAVKLSLPNQNDTQITFERKMSNHHKTLHVHMGHSNKESNFTKFLDLTGELIDRNYHVWKGTLDVNTYSKVKHLISSGYSTVKNTVIAVSKDQDHPLNQILKPALKVNLYDYWKNTKAEVHDFFSNAWFEVQEVFYALVAFTEPGYSVLVNTYTGVKEFCRGAYIAVKDKSIIIWAVNYFYLPHYFQQGFTNLPHAVSLLVQQQFLEEDGVMHFRFKTGKIFAWRSFNELPYLSFYYPRLRSWIFYESNTNEHSNEFKFAMIFGPLHVYTFDRHLYDVPKYPHKDCAFLLAHDVHKSLFTVYSTERGIHVLFPEMSIMIDDQNEVFINGSQKPSYLPIQTSNGKVTIKGGETVEVWSPSLSVICSSKDFLCILKLSEFHDGGVVGLLGNADEFPENDFMLPNGNTSSSLTEYVTSYEISGKPECKNPVLSAKPVPTDEEVAKCSAEFQQTCSISSLMRDQFLDACVSDVRAGHDTCYATAGLAAMCYYRFPVPTQTKCNAKKQESTNIRQNLEVLFVVQESKHLTSPDHSNAPGKGLESLIRALDTKFKDNGYGSVKYSLVGFGGNGVHYAPTVHSFHKNIWLPADDMVKGVLKTLEFRNKENADSMLALKFALEELGYDTFDSKVVIVITAKDKQVADKYTVENIHHHLERNGITLYTFSSYPSIEKGKKVYGVRADGLIFPSQTKDGDAYLDYPRGSLAKLTSSTRGSLFLTKFLRENKPSSFFTEFAQEVWAKVHQEAQKCRRCRSVRGSWWWFRNECTIVDC